MLRTVVWRGEVACWAGPPVKRASARARPGGRFAAATWSASAVLALAAIAAPSVAGAKPPRRELVVGVGAHLASAVGDSCRRNLDVVECTDFVPFAGLDLTAQYWLGELLTSG